MSRYLLALIPAALFGLVAVYFSLGLQRDPRIIPSALIDQAVPAFELPPLADGKPGLSNADLTGEVTMVNVFASWCVPCRFEHPLLMRLAADKIVTVHGLNWKDKPEDATRWLQELGDPYTRIGSDPSGRVGIDWGVYGVPETYIVDADGRIRYKQVGPMTPELLDQTVLPLIESLKR
ncbi:MAG: DsbE family thiol:disulfide interchange protein [Kiloniellales bacterium]